ncbi:MAG: coproporphyrinogen III oxidase family protein [Desulfobacterales bacterium]|nr:coproporphyrinogen III oxidase family protein [Desulfobacterales bacterium]
MKKELIFPTPSRKGFITNYPPYRQWKRTAAESILPGKPINVYVHIPFCIQRCAYCYYRTNDLKGIDRRKFLNRYVDALCREIELTAQKFHLQDRPVLSIYFGGGTPTILTSDQLERLGKTLFEHLNVDSPEFTVEAEPVTLTPKKAALLKKMHVNRISLGVQSFRDEILEICNRLDNEEKALKAVDIARSMGAVVNIDLLSGLAAEKGDSWAYTIDRALSSGAESITIYKMELYANTDYYKSLRRKKIELPDNDNELSFMNHALDEFEKADYLPWCFFTFTKNGNYKHTYISSVWEGNDCFAFGASAFGELGSRLYQNTNDEEKYMSRLEAGELPVNRGYHLTGLEQMIRTVLLGMKLLSLDLEKFRQRFGIPLETLCGEAIDKMEGEGYITTTKDALTLTRKGILYGDYTGRCLAAPLVEMGK